MKAINKLAKVRKNVGANLAPRFLFTLALLLPASTLVLAATQVDTRANAVANTELIMRLELFEQEIKNLRNMVEQQENLITKMQAEQRNRYLDLDQRAQEYAKRILALEETPISAPPSHSQPSTAEQPIVSSTSKATTTATSPAPQQSDQQAYNKAYAFVPEQRFEEATSSFQDFIRNYPESRLIGNAYYWLGEIYMAQNRTADAEKMFNAVVSKHPDSFKIADSKYKLGLIYARYGNNAKAKETMEAVIAEHPREPAADLARGYLKK